MILTASSWYAARNEARRLLVGAVEDQSGWTLTATTVLGKHWLTEGARVRLVRTEAGWRLGPRQSHT